MHKIKFINSLALLSGATLTLGFAPFNLWILSFISLIVLIWLIDNLNRADQHQILRKYTNLGLAWGIGFFGTNVSWIFVSIYKYGNTNFFTATLITLLFILYLSIFPIINLVLLKIFNLTNPKDPLFLIIFPSSWVLLEMIRSWFLTGFPFGLLGYTQLNTSLKYYASLIGVYGVSFIILFIVTLFYWLLNKKLLIKLIVSSSIILLFILGLQIKKININHNVTINKIHNIAIIQGNITPNDKFLFSNTYNLINTINETYWKPTINLLANKSNKDHAIDLVIWPENSLPIDLNHPEAKKFLTKINLIAKKNNFGLLIGAPMLVPRVHGSKYQSSYYYNSVLGLGTVKGIYYKIKLVPFGDYVPIEKWLRGLINFFNLPMSNFLPGKIDQPGILFENNNILATVCYDIGYPTTVRHRVLELNPSVIVAISEDGWFGNSLGPHQHLDLARMRAIETGRFVLRATTSGISANINPHGEIINRSELFKKAIVLGSYQDCFKHTLWNKIGNKPLIIFLLICLLISIIIIRIRGRKVGIRV